MGRVKKQLKIPSIQEAMIDLHKPRGDAKEIGMTTSLHEGQIKLLKPLYDPETTLIFGACARKWSKSETAIYAAWRHALENPGAVVYLVGPEASHITNIYWDGFRIQRYLGDDSEKYIRRIKDRERTIEFHNNSIIKLMGSENWKAGQGLSPSLLIYDEFKAFHPKFHTEMGPNVAAKGAKLFIIGTHPQVGDRNKSEYDATLLYCKENPKNAAFFEFTVWDSPLNQIPARKHAIEQHIAQLRAEGREDTVQREYFSKIIPGGSRAVFPMFSRERHVSTSTLLKARIKGHEDQFDWINVIDPAGSGVYGGIFVAYHRRTKHLFLLDELYIKDKMLSSTSKTIPIIMQKMKELAPHVDYDDWIKVCDEQATMTIIEILSQYPRMAYMATQKRLTDKEIGLSTLRDALNFDLLVLSDTCENAAMEIEEYSTNDEGIIVKNRHSKDHLIDSLRYLVQAINYNVVPDPLQEKKIPALWNWVKDGFSGFGPEDYIEEDREYMIDDIFEDEDFDYWD